MNPLYDPVNRIYNQFKVVYEKVMLKIKLSTKNFQSLYRRNLLENLPSLKRLKYLLISQNQKAGIGSIQNISSLHMQLLQSSQEFVM